MCLAAYFEQSLSRSWSALRRPASNTIFLAFDEIGAIACSGLEWDARKSEQDRDVARRGRGDFRLRDRMGLYWGVSSIRKGPFRNRKRLCRLGGWQSYTVHVQMLWHLQSY